MKNRTFAFDYSGAQPDPEAYRNIANAGLRFRPDFAGTEAVGTWDTNISSKGVVYTAPACEHTKDIQTSLLAYDFAKDAGYICFRSEHYTLPRDRVLPHTKLHESITELPDGRIVATTHSTSAPANHPEWMPFAHLDHVWEGFPGSYILVYDPVTGKTENWGMPVPRESIYGMTYDKKYNALYMIGFMRGHVYRFDIDKKTVKDLGKAAEVFCYRLHRGPDDNIYGMTKSGYLWRVNVDTQELEDMNWRHPAYYDNSFTNTWYRYMADARNVPAADGKPGHEFVFTSYTSDNFYLFDTDTLQVTDLGPKFPFDDHNNVRHTEFCLNEFIVDKFGVLWYMVQPVILGNPAPEDYRKYTLPSYLMRWDYRAGEKPEILGVVSDNEYHLTYATGVCYDPNKDILFLMGNMFKCGEYGEGCQRLGVACIELEKFRPVMHEKGEICSNSGFLFVPFTEKEIEEAKEKQKNAPPFPEYSGEEVPKGNPFQAFPGKCICPLRLWRQVPYTDIPASAVVGLAWDDNNVLHGTCGRDGKAEYYFEAAECDFDVLGKTLEEADENPTMWLYKGIFGKFTPELRDGVYGIKPPFGFSWRVTKFVPYAEICECTKKWLDENLLPKKQEPLDESIKLPEVAGRRYLAKASYVEDWKDGQRIAGTNDGLLGIIRPDGSVYSLGNCAPFGPVRCMTNDTANGKLWGVAGDVEDMGMIFTYDDRNGIMEVGHLNYNAPNMLDGPSSSNVLSSIAVSKDGKWVAIGGMDRIGSVHIARTENVRTL